MMIELVSHLLMSCCLACSLLISRIKIGLYTTIYITLMGIFGTVASMVCSTQLFQATSWKFYLFNHWSHPLSFTYLVANVKNNRYMFVTGNQSEKTSSLWKNKACHFLILVGCNPSCSTQKSMVTNYFQSIGFRQKQKQD